MSKLAALTAQKALNSRGEWTLKVTARSSDGRSAAAHYPRGKSFAPCETRDLDLDKIVCLVSGDLQSALMGRAVVDQEQIDAIIEERATEARGCGTALVAASMAIAQLGSSCAGLPLWKYLRQCVLRDQNTERCLPLPFLTLFMGGLHKYPFQDQLHRAGNFQVVQIVPFVDNVLEAIEIAREVYRAITLRLLEEGSYRGFGQDGGIAFFGTNEEMLELATREATTYFERRSMRPSFAIALDIAASHLKTGARYEVCGTELEPEGMLGYVSDLIKRYPICSVEDPFHFADRDCWRKLLAANPDLEIVGDDVFAADVQRIREGSREGLANAILLKPNYAHSVSEMGRIVGAARELDLSVVVSHRSGETCDTFVADLAAAISGSGRFCVGLRAGAPYCGERVCKWNRLLEIAGEADWAGLATFRASPAPVSSNPGHKA